MSKKLSTFLDSWLNERLYPRFASWVRRVPSDDGKAYCSLCCKAFSLSSMGQQALVSHIKSGSHRRSVDEVAGQPSILAHYRPQTSQSSARSSQIDASSETPRDSCSLDDSSPTQVTAHSMESFRLRDGVTKAKVLWCLKSVCSHYSFRSAQGLNEMFKEMFPDSPIAHQFSLSRTKVAYTIVFGLAPYFKQQMLRILQSCDEFVVCFDESLNRIAQRGQMDLIVRYWDLGTNRVTSRYFSSVFMGRSTAADLLSAFNKGMKDVPLVKILQISMDGPSVNHKFYRNFVEQMSQGEEVPGLINVGTCGLHIVNGAYQTGCRATGWDVAGFLRALYRLFKDSPARRSSYKTLTGSEVYPLKFCSVRWTENSAVASRAIAMLKPLCRWISEVDPKPSSDTFESVKMAVTRDPLLNAKLNFFKAMAELMEPFLTTFQSPAPMFPFLHEALQSLLFSLMRKFVKSDTMPQCGTAAKMLLIDINERSEALRAKVDIGFGASRALEAPSVTQLQRTGFYSDCKKLYIKSTGKLIERCSIGFKSVRSASSLSPVTIKSNKGLCENRFQSLLEVLLSANRISVSVADKAKEQYSVVLASDDYFQKICAYTRTTQLDEFYGSLLGDEPLMSELYSVVKKVLVISHGNATVESGFSVNDDMLVENLKEDSLVGLRIVYDAIMQAGGPLSVTVTPQLMRSVRCAAANYRASTGRKRQRESTEVRDQLAVKRKAKEQLAALQEKKKSLSSEVATEMSKLEFQMRELQKRIQS